MIVVVFDLSLFKNCCFLHLYCVCKACCCGCCVKPFWEGEWLWWAMLRIAFSALTLFLSSLHTIYHLVVSWFLLLFVLIAWHIYVSVTCVLQHNLCCDNCHSHVAYALNLMKYDSRTSWNMITLCFLMLIHGRYVRYCSQVVCATQLKLTVSKLNIYASCVWNALPSYLWQDMTTGSLSMHWKHALSVTKRINHWKTREVLMPVMETDLTLSSVIHQLLHHLCNKRCSLDASK